MLEKHIWSKALLSVFSESIKVCLGQDGVAKIQGPLSGSILGCMLTPTWRFMGLSNYYNRLITLLIIGVTIINPFRGVISRVISPVICSY